MYTNLSARETREGKFFLRAPLMVAPLLTLIFWGLGGGKAAYGSKVVLHGFEMRIPPAHVASIVKLDKLEYYEAAKRDSAALAQRQRIENSYARVLGLTDSGSALVRRVQEKLGVVNKALGARGAAGLGGPGFGVAAGARLGAGVAGRARLGAGARGEMGLSGAGLRGALGVAAGARGVFGAGAAVRTPGAIAASGRVAEGPNLEKLERMMTVLQRDEGGNTEIAELTEVLDRLAALQGGLRRDTLQRKPGGVVLRRAVATIKALPDADDTTRGFDSAAIEAIVPEEQVVVSGGELRLELAGDVLVGAVRVPAGTPVYGAVSLSGERLRVSISSIVCQDRVLPVSLQVDDEDGLAGIHIPGAPMTDAVREAMGSEVGGIGPTVLNTGVAGQAIDAGVSLGRQLIGKKIRPVRVTVPAGYRVLLHPSIASL